MGTERRYLVKQLALEEREVVGVVKDLALSL